MTMPFLVTYTLGVLLFLGGVALVVDHILNDRGDA